MHGYEIQNPIHILVRSGPGTGKSFLTRCLNNAAQEMEMEYSLMCVAFTGSVSQSRRLPGYEVIKG
ncbi:hypothetical protein OUZ56_009827 [Daphnia magna]|uniref:ATP-dependent DNA helicase n=1 Tax=Daphnia magna TaxID=35525 RepID=A0ABR0AGZ5_9CRUS|nr:hypothetical protein OUZ56_009827 [Daphnia magna]